MKPQIYYDDVQLNMEIAPISKGPMSTMHIMRWSAAIENWHRIHYDQPFAVGHDKLPDVLVNGSWKQHVLVQMMKDWVGTGGWVWKTKFNFRDKDLPGDIITARGTVTAKYVRGDHGYVECAIRLENQRGVQSTTGEAVAVLPIRGGKPVPYPFVPDEPA
ncbi:MAG: acyl dehydratase [Burkholderiaceae bacterium]